MAVHDDKKEKPNVLKIIGKNSLALAEMFPGLDKPVALIKYLSEFHEEQKTIRIKRYCNALVNCVSATDYTAANELATEVEFADLLQACVSDSDSNKAEAYAQLTVTLKFGSLAKEYRRHFMLSLKQLSYEDLELLRLAGIAIKYDLIPKHGCEVLSQSDIFSHHNLGVIRSLSVEVLRQLGLIKPEGITELGQLFIKSVYSRELCEHHADYDMWQNPPVVILVGGKKDSHSEKVIDNFKSLRIRCVTVPIVSFPKGLDQYQPYKAIIFAGDYEGLTSGKTRELVAFTASTPHQCINLDYKLSTTSEGMQFRYVDFNDAQTLAEKVAIVARCLGFIVDL